MNEELKENESYRVDERLYEELPSFLVHIRKLINDGPTPSQNNEVKFDYNSKAYIKTTENINGYYDNMDLEGKSVLSVVGSSDQIFEAILRGAKKVSGFDISINAIMFYYLKEAAIKTLTYEDYIAFFYIEHTRFRREIYEKIRENLNPIGINFWDMIFHQKEKTPFEIISNIITDKRGYMSIMDCSHRLSSLSSHLTNHNYYLLKRKLKESEIDIYLCDVKELDRIDGLYDYIILSNIFEYQKGEDLIEFKKAIERYSEKLTEKGQIMVGYAYHDVDLSSYEEFEKEKIPSRYKAWGNYNAPEDVMITARKR